MENTQSMTYQDVLGIYRRYRGDEAEIIRVEGDQKWKDMCSCRKAYLNSLEYSSDDGKFTCKNPEITAFMNDEFRPHTKGYEENFSRNEAQFWEDYHTEILYNIAYISRVDDQVMTDGFELVREDFDTLVTFYGNKLNLLRR